VHRQRGKFQVSERNVTEKLQGDVRDAQLNGIQDRLRAAAAVGLRTETA
jgi:hypothetical protein